MKRIEKKEKGKEKKEGSKGEIKRRNKKM